MSVPRPPADVARRTPAFETLAAGADVHRFFGTAFDPIHFDRSDRGRFNDPAGNYGVLYTAKSQRGAFAETFLRTPDRTVLATDVVAGKGYVRIQVTRPLRLIRLAGAGLARVGATAEVVHGGPPYAIAQSWSAALHTHPSMADGIAYNARHDDEALCFAIFDRAADALREVHRDTRIDAGWFWEIGEFYGVGLAP